VSLVGCNLHTTTNRKNHQVRKGEPEREQGFLQHHQVTEHTTNRKFVATITLKRVPICDFLPPHGNSY